MDNDGLEKFMLEKAGIWVNRVILLGAGQLHKNEHRLSRPILEGSWEIECTVNSL